MSKLELTKEELKEHFWEAEEQLAKMIEKNVHKAAFLAVGELDKSTKKYLNKRTGRGGGGRKTSAVSGSAGLAGSWKPVFLGRKGNVVSAGAYSSLPYAGVHETGKKISAKSKKLAIPVNVGAELVGPRDFPGKLRWYPYRGDKPNIVGVLGEPSSSGKGYTVHYALADWVVIPKTQYITKARKELRPVVQKLIANGLATIITGTK